MDETTDAVLAQLTAAAAAAAPVLAALPAERRAELVRTIADRVDSDSDSLAAIADQETSLGMVRLRGEVARTSGQLRMFGNVVVEGSYVEAIIDTADPSALPPKPDLRRMLVPIGPVAVFSASNFPFAFSVVGGDTASALAAGCPVVVKAHSGHPRLSNAVAEIVHSVVSELGLPAGTFGLVHGREIGRALVVDPAIKAAGFTGSVNGGRALFDLASGRPDPIPFYGELGSLNSVVVTPAAAASRGQEIATGLVSSFTLGVGQFCTKPGVVLVPDGAGIEKLVADALPSATGGRMLTPSIHDAYTKGLAAIEGTGKAERLGAASEGGEGVGVPAAYSTTVADLLERSDVLLEECFGPVALLVRYADAAELTAALAALPPALTATADDDVELAGGQHVDEVGDAMRSHEH
ncbi:MAG: aldehyde dehydrogenase family protein, partial [Mycobacteriales bacterium]